MISSSEELVNKISAKEFGENKSKRTSKSSSPELVTDSVNKNAEENLLHENPIIPEENDNITKENYSTVTCKMIVAHGREIVCLIALILTTYATIHNKPTKFGRPPPPKPFFHKTSVVQDWPAGNLDILQARVSAAELSLVFFYAPWCAESNYAKNVYEEVASRFYKKIYFGAINCWQPNGECRLQYAKVHSWPVLMVYFPRGLAVQYNGLWNSPSLTRFVEGLLNPIYRITRKDELNKLQANSDAVVVVFVEHILKSNYYSSYVQTAIKWLENDPLQDVRFAVVSGYTGRLFNITTFPALKLYIWNNTLDYSTNKWSSVNIISWLRIKMTTVITWVNLPGKKSSLLATYLRWNPSLVIFTPRDYYMDNNSHFTLVKQAALEYFGCRYNYSLDDSFNQHLDVHRTEDLKKLNFLRKYCGSSILAARRQSCQMRRNNNECRTEGNKPILFNDLKYNEKIKEYCPADASKISKDNLNRWTSMLNSTLDVRSAKNLLEEFNDHLCEKLELFQKNTVQTWEYLIHNNDGFNFDETMCKRNKSLSFLLLDSRIYNDFSENLVPGALNNSMETAVYIIDSTTESTFKMDEPLSISTLKSFVYNFHQGNLTRNIRSKTSGVQLEKSSNTISIAEIDSLKFRHIVEFSNSTTVILFHSSQCALCSLLSQMLLKIANKLRSLNIEFYRIDGDLNDLPWEYTMDLYPTLIIFPSNRRAETRVFPHNVEITEKNILGFILANITPIERLKAIFEYCFPIKIIYVSQNCIATLKREILNEIARNLKNWRHYPTWRVKTLRRLQVLQNVYMSLFQIKKIDIAYYKKLLWKKYVI